MAALRTNLKAMMIELVAALPGIGITNVTPHKLDKVEKGTEASVYLEEIESEPVGMRGIRARTQRINVSLFLSDATDAEAVGSELINTLEASVEATRRNGGFNDPSAISGVYLESGTFVHDPNSKGKRVDVHATFVFTFTESIA
jgi:hypothetical protein